MRIVILGSAGRTGQELLRQAVNRGHEVTAYTRRPHLATKVHGLHMVVHGDLSDPVMLERAISGRDGVLSVIGPSNKGNPRVVVDAARMITSVATDMAVRRVVMRSSYSIVADRPRIRTTLTRLLSSRYLAAQELADRLVMQSQLDWTVVRATPLNEEAPRGEVQLSTEFLRTGPWTTPRGDLATVMLDLIEDPDWIQTTANVTGSPWSDAEADPGGVDDSEFVEGGDTGPDDERVA